MRNLIIAGTVVIAAWFGDASSRAYAAWCARDTYGSLNCSFTSLEQCRAAVSGIGGACYDNGSGNAAPAAPKKKKPVDQR